MGSPNPLLGKDLSGFGEGLASSDCDTLFVLNEIKAQGILSFLSSQMKFLKVLMEPVATAIIWSLTPLVMGCHRVGVLSIAVVKAYGGTSDGHLNRWDSHF
jgi:hypothetical protein